LGTEYFNYDEARHALVGSRSGAMHRLGDVVDVRLVEAAPVAGALRFELLSEGRVRRADEGASARAKFPAQAKAHPGRSPRKKDRKPGKSQSPANRRRGFKGQVMETVSADQGSGPGIPVSGEKRDVWTALKRGFARPLPALRRRQAVSRLPEGRRSLLGCGQDFTPHRADDLPAYLVIVIVGHIVVPMCCGSRPIIRRRSRCNSRSICHSR
jgi:hypothetical protein